MDASILRAARIARRLSREKVADLTKLSPRVVAAIDDGCLHELPGGIYARSYVRSYARVVGLDDPDLIQPLIDALPLADIDLPAIYACREVRSPDRTACRLAVAVDAGVVAVTSAAGVMACAVVTGPLAWDAVGLAIAFLALAVPTAFLYFGLLGAIGAGTPGARLLGVDFVPPVNKAIDGAELARRTRQYVRSEARALLSGRIGTAHGGPSGAAASRQAA